MALISTPRGYWFKNWAGTQQAPVAQVSWPASEADVARQLRLSGERGERVKVTGAGHSWSDASVPDTHLMSLDRLAGLVGVDEESGEVTVWGGTRLKDLNALLAARGMAMPVLGSIAEQSVAGAISTGTHGSAPRLGNLASLVSRLRLAVPGGEVIEASAEREPEVFQAARVGLGALGVITQVTLRCVPAFRLEEESFPCSFDRALDELDGRLAREEFFKIWWLPHTDQAQVFCYRRTGLPSTFDARARWVDEAIVNGQVFAGALRAVERRPGLIPGFNRLVGATYFRPARRVAPSHLSFNIAMPPVHDETEAALPVGRSAEAMRWLRDFIEREGLAVNFVVELRFGAGDDAWLSPAHGRASCFLGAYIANERDRGRYFDGFERYALSVGGRPHWGKAFRATGAELRPLYPRFGDFDALRRRLDPGGMLLNPFLERVFLR